MLPDISTHPLIGLAGFARSGKDTVATRLVGRHGYFQDSFAAPIRRFVSQLLNITLEQLEKIKDDPYPLLNTTPRYMMQSVGTEWGRNLIDQNIWIKLAMNRAEHYRKMGVPVVLSDIRFENEAQAVRDAGGIVIHVIRDKSIQVNEHASENGIYLHPGDYGLENFGTITELFLGVDKILKQVQPQ